MKEKERHRQLSDLEFAKQFKDCILDPALFSHEAHLRLAWIHITKHGLNQAIKNVCDQIVAFTHSLGASTKFNKTLTVAAVKIVYHFIQKSKSDNFQDFMVEFPRMKYNFQDLLNAHYQIDIFNSEKAKKEFLEPDILPFE